MKGVPFSVQQNLMLFNGDKILLKQFLLLKSPEEHEVYQEYLIQKRKQVKYIPIVSAVINIGMVYHEPMLLLFGVPVQGVALWYFADKYDHFQIIQTVFDEVDVESKQ